jgi:glycine hydroxymethyltransferase
MMTDKDYMFHADLANLDGDVQHLIQLEEERQSRRIILIPSESMAPAAVREALGSVFSHIYAEGYPPLRMTRDDETLLLDYGHQLAYYRRYADRRFYKGADYVNFAETLAQRRAAACFANDRVGADQIYVNVQALSGAAANNSIYEAFVQPGDTVMGMNLMHGGHLTHGSQFNRSGKRYHIVSYNVDPKTERLDYDAILQLALEHRPKMIIAGYTSYPWAPDWAKFREIADAVGAVLMADIAHTAGMAIAGVYPSPVGIADVTVFTTHKTLCGPRAAVILTTDEERAAKVDNAVFPGEQGGPHVNKFVALAVAFKLAQSPQFKALQRQIVANASALAASLQKRGLRLAYGGTDTHLLLADLRSVKSPTGNPLRGEVAARLLEICGIVVNKNTIPGDEVTALASGIRLGTPWVTQRGMREPEMDQIADLIYRVVSDIRPFAYAGLGGELPRGKATLPLLKQVSWEVDELAARFDPQPRQRSAYPHYPLLSVGEGETSWTESDEKAVASALEDASLLGSGESVALLVRGLRVAAFLQETGTANIAALQGGHAAQTVILDADGRVIDDIIVVRLAQNARGEDRYCVIANAPNAPRVKDWFRALSDGYVVFDNEDIFRKVQGPVVVEDIPAGSAGFLARRKPSVLPPRDESAPRLSGLALYEAGHQSLFDLSKPYFVGQASLAPSAPVDALPEFAWQPKEGGLMRTPLYDEHKKRTRKLIPFAGWEMPVWYTSVGEEHAAVRKAAGLFDVAHMGVLDVTGPHAVSFLDAVSSNYARWLDPGQSQYAYLFDPDGNVIDDIMIYCLRRDRYMVVVNAANADKDWAWLNAVNEGKVSIDGKRPYVKVEAPAVLRDLKDPRWGTDCRVDLALQGPASLAILQTLAQDSRKAAELTRIRRTDLLETELAGMPIVVSRTGYTGEPMGFELFVHPESAVRLWNLLLERGEPFGIRPAGLAARDSTRIEAGLPLYGHELAGDYNVSPEEAGFAAYVKVHKPFFVGREAIMARGEASHLSIARFRVNSSTARAFRGHEPVVNRRGQYIGRVTSCTLVEDAQVGMALVDKRYAQPGTEIAIYPTASAKTDKPVAFGDMTKGDQTLLPEWCTVLPRFRGAEASVPATAGE